MLNRLVAGFCAAFLLAIPATVSAQSMNHAAHQHAATHKGPVPTEPGQSAFAAIAEIVELLKADPETDWDRVDIDQLRTHLVDMNELTLNAVVEQQEQPDTVVFIARGTGRTLDALRRMVPAHAEQLNSSTPWQTSASSVDGGVRLTVTTADPGELQIVRAIGFFGVMATGAHHQQHHLAMARGDMEY